MSVVFVFSYALTSMVSIFHTLRQLFISLLYAHSVPVGFAFCLMSNNYSAVSIYSKNIDIVVIY